jgi:phosphatidylglycerol lysyltransferase
MAKRRIFVWIIALVTFGSGVNNLLLVIRARPPAQLEFLRDIFPLEFIHITRSLTVLAGFALIVSSLNIYKRKKRALQAVAFLSALSVVLHLTRGREYGGALFSSGVLVLLLVARKQFTVRSSIPDFRSGVSRLLVALLSALGYGALGFWFLHKRHFGTVFSFRESLRETLLYLIFQGDPSLRPRTAFAHWFLDSLYLISGIAILYSLYALFRPVFYAFRTHPRERAEAAEIVAKYGRSSMDYFKAWPDKSFFFSATSRSFLAYGVSSHFAVVLGDPVGPEEEIEGIIRDFLSTCEGNDWGVTFQQTLPDFLPQYRKLGLKKLKIGDEAIVDLTTFSLEGKKMKHLRHYSHQFEKAGVRAAYTEPPLPDSMVEKARRVSDDWLRIPGRRERGFTQGIFGERYVRSTPMYSAVDVEGRMLAFVNIIPSFRRGETTIDLMRHRIDAPPGIMDFLLVRLFQFEKERGFERFSLGMAPMSGFTEKEEAGPEEKIVHTFIGRLNFLFSYQGLLQHKAKFASSWEPRYIIYRNVFDLPKLSLVTYRLAERCGKELVYE